MAVVASGAQPARAESGPFIPACFETGASTWAPFRSEVDLALGRGEITRFQADRYRCDPRIAQADLVKKIEAELAANPPALVTLPESANWYEVDDDDPDPAEAKAASVSAAAKPKKRCVSGYQLTHKLGGGTLTAIQTLNWCYNGKKVSDWSGECRGTVSKWGKALLWSFDGCSQNDFIPYKLGKYNPGGIHHKTNIRFTNKQWQVPDVSTLTEQWGHYNGTIDQMVDGKLLHK
ncbi:hypothetical protein Q0Z83_017550 [Actinoplanes sichuanensis]|uniref:Uncharacterized protein n=1 Tax=Actinoplanes sichuanensis TaxID=512349 RepID=A0ABW4A705_9ACTN|nr:hypothetical protein [Actinoplanes sichuanensis]BEL03564.1 hypothetical protein Q0Z83_017550 [Actinoplanes sichuanensis]